MDNLDKPAKIHQSEDAAAPEAQAEVKRLAALDPAAYETARKDAAARLGWRASFLDAEVTNARPRKANAGEDDDTPEAIETIKVWPDPVEGASLAEEIRDRLHAHVVFASPADADCAAIWLLGSYLMDTWRLWPRLLITSPTRACGKSTLLEVLEAMAHRGIIASNASPAVIFRAIEAWQPTLLLDEADTWMKANEELAGILNSGHTHRTANVLRTVEVKGELVPAKFSTWCPMVIAGIGTQRDTLMSRSIIIGLRRKLPDETVERLPFDLHRQLHRIRRQAARWADDNALRIGAMEIEPPACGNDRLQDNFTPLTRIAAALGRPWPERVAAAYATKVAVDDDDAEPAGVMMLRDIAELFAARHVDRIANTEIVSELMMLEDRPWMEWRNGKPISAGSVAKLMKPFGIKVTVKKLGGAAARVYLRSEVESAAARYVPSTRSPVTYKQNQQVNLVSKCNPAPKVTSNTIDNPLNNNEGYAVTPRAPESDYISARDDQHNPDAWR
ncbi:DUF3631 domain-containing protein [Roseinatronobacter monicus]|uniref:Uncharacterized protein DUF3631 n=1 Tax=Roseinatronobacter monicus TaxID=393481 RepID=A0A543KBL2_9RHOB|nr:DUF3631 domain-containing protein [Roseinatronobacter monicus]TQM92446.1 uncharacterized protein DUF3631 [Roseinatronobacter monicus]